MEREKYSVNNMLEFLNCDDSDAGDTDSSSEDENLGLMQVTWSIEFVLTITDMSH